MARLRLSMQNSSLLRATAATRFVDLQYVRGGHNVPTAFFSGLELLLTLDALPPLTDPQNGSREILTASSASSGPKCTSTEWQASSPALLEEEPGMTACFRSTMDESEFQD